MNFYVASAGQPDEDYLERNFERIITQKSFNLHENTPQKGAYEKVQKGDILILKYNDLLVCYGKVKGNRNTKGKEFNLWIDVDYWVSHDLTNIRKGISKKGIQDASISGGQYGTIKEVKSAYALKKLKQINKDNLLYSYINENHMLTDSELKSKEIEGLLLSKKQIILQGPPGTGKTRLAEEIAKQITEKNSNYSVKERIEYFFKSFKLNDTELIKRNKIEQELQVFKDKFPKDKISEIGLEEYTLGQSDKDGFCYWLEYKLIHTGKYNGAATKFKIYFNNENNSYVKTGIAEGLNDIEAGKVVVEKIQELVNDPMNVGKNFPMGKGLVLKILNTYFSETFFPISSEGILDQLLIALEKDIKGKNYLEKNKEVQTYFKEQNTVHNTNAKNFEFMHYLFQKNVLSEEEHSVEVTTVKKDFYKVIQFHASYSYEDFVRGIAVETTEKGNVVYTVKNRILAQMAQDAIDDENNNYVLIIDEINRANLSSVLGELIYALEYRGEPVESLYDLKGKGREIVIPKNLYIIGTMNTADRSVGHIDYAIRRRFAFVDVLPKVLLDSDLNLNKKDGDDTLYFKEDIFSKVQALFSKNEENKINHLSEEFKAKDVTIGHSYFIYKNDAHFAQRLEYEIKPILEEYMKDGVLKESDGLREKINGLLKDA